MFYVGTYTGPKSQGIYLYDLNLGTGDLVSLGLAGETVNPSFLMLHPNGRFLYCVNERGDFQGRKTGSVTAFAIDPATRKLTLLNQQPSEGTAPCYLTVDPGGKYVLVANYGSGSFAVLPIAADGSIGAPCCKIQDQGKGANPKRQEGPHAHSINVAPGGKFVLAADLGIDQLLVYRLDAAGQLVPNQPPFAPIAAGSGPRHVSFSPDGRFAYLINELSCTIVAFAWDALAGRLTELQTLSTLPSDFTGESTCAEVKVHPSGRFVYGSNRGHDSIAIYSADPSSGKLTPVGIEPTRGKQPRHFGIDPSGQFLIAAHQNSDNLVVFRIDQVTGKLAFVKEAAGPGTPVCIRFITK